MKTKYIISLSALVALTGAQCWGAAESDDQLARRLNYEELGKLCRGDYSNSKLSQDVFEKKILMNMSAASLMNLAVAQPKLYPFIKTIPQFVLLQQNMNKEMEQFNNDHQKVFVVVAIKNYPEAIDVIEYLALSPYVNINALDDILGTQALIRAVQMKNPAMVELLLARGANIDTQDRLGYTALIWAVDKNNLAMVELLLARKANISLTDRKGNAALRIASRELKSFCDDQNQNEQSRARTIIELLEKAADNK